jgi:riboflavin kinase / FMN adenylyltransferase
MPVEDELARVSPSKEMIITIGVFDGVHIGHRALISELMAQAKEASYLAGVITLSRPPEDIFHPESQVPYITSLDDRICRLKATGADVVIPMMFTPDMAEITAREFVTLLMKCLKMRGLVIGEDFALGKWRRGNPAFLKKLGRELGFRVTVVPPVILNGEIVSSTAVRKALASGDMDKAADLLGRPFSLKRPVVKGSGRGRTLGFPTANLDIEAEQALPGDGVYATYTIVGGRKFESMTNVGRNPTFEAGQRTVETYIIDYNGDLYDKPIEVCFITRLRGEKKFDSAEALTIQIKSDIAKGRKLLAETADNFGPRSY